VVKGLGTAALAPTSASAWERGRNKRPPGLPACGFGPGGWSSLTAHCGLRPTTEKDSNLILANSRNSISLELRSAARKPSVSIFVAPLLDRPLGP